MDDNRAADDRVRADELDKGILNGDLGDAIVSCVDVSKITDVAVLFPCQFAGR